MNKNLFTTNKNFYLKSYSMLHYTKQRILLKNQKLQMYKLP